MRSQMKIRVADYIAGEIASRGLETVFTIVGGGAMHLNDAFGKHPKISCIYNHNEQACTIAAEGYAKISGKTGVSCVTTGPGGMNAVSGVMGAYLDSIPMLVISGQVKYETTVRSTGLALRQMGDQEFDITKTVQTMTKYAVMVTDPLEIRYHLDKALFLAENGRPGPCWLDIPMNVQGAIIETDDLRHFNAAELTGTMAEIGLILDDSTHDYVKKQSKDLLDRIKNAKRPVLYVGNGIHIAKAEKEFVTLIQKLNIPVVAGFNAHDVMPYDSPLYIGRPGTIGDRAGNFAVQNADLLIILGCRLGIRQIGYSWDSFAREAYKVMVDIDQAEMDKPSLKINTKINTDVKLFTKALIAEIDASKWQNIHTGWVDWCIARKHKYKTVLPEYWERKDMINPYCFMEKLGDALEEQDVVVAANATACICSFQALHVKQGQRIFSNSGSAPMGYDLPAAIGVASTKLESQAGTEWGQVICLAGDGSIQMNLQELQTIVNFDLPIKIFVLNNKGYHSIRQTQANFFGQPLVGCCNGEPKQGLPEMQKLAQAYNIPYNRASNHEDMEGAIKEALGAEGAFICEVMLTPEQIFAPKPASIKLEDGRMVSQPLENLFPFLPREEFLENIIIKPIED